MMYNSVSSSCNVLYLGGVPGLSLINPSAAPGEPSAFIGCIREFIVDDKKYQLTKEGELYVVSFTHYNLM